MMSDSATPDDLVIEQWICTCCGYVYEPEMGDPEHGIAPGTPFEDLPEEWRCPVCKALKSAFDTM